MPKHFDESVVEHGFGAAVRDIRLSVSRERHNRRFRVALVRNLNVRDLSELREVIVEMGDRVETSRNLPQLQRAVLRRILSLVDSRSESAVDWHLSLSFGQCDAVFRLKSSLHVMFSRMVRIHYRHWDELARERRDTGRQLLETQRRTSAEIEVRLSRCWHWQMHSVTWAKSRRSSRPQIRIVGIVLAVHLSITHVHVRRIHGQWRIAEIFQNDWIDSVVPRTRLASHAVAFLIEVATTFALLGIDTRKRRVAA